MPALFPVTAVKTNRNKYKKSANSGVVGSCGYRWNSKCFSYSQCSWGLDRGSLDCKRPKMDVNAVLQSFHPKVKPYIKEVLYSGNVGEFILCNYGLVCPKNYKNK